MQHTSVHVVISETVQKYLQLPNCTSNRTEDSQNSSVHTTHQSVAAPSLVCLFGIHNMTCEEECIESLMLPFVTCCVMDIGMS